MAKKNRPEPLDTSALKTLTGEGGTGYLPQEQAEKLRNAGLILIHETLKDSKGNPAVKLTDAGASLANNGANMAKTETASTGEANVQNFVIDSDIAMPERRAGGIRASRYPFDALQPGQSFHIPATDKVPNPAKKYSSIASSANRRYGTAVVDPATGQPVMVTRTRKMRDGTQKTTQGKKLAFSRTFSIRPAGADDPRGPGARVFRVK